MDDEERVYCATYGCFSPVVNDETWKLYGYSRHPRGGWLWQRLFKPRWKRDIEDSLAREIFITSVAFNLKQHVLSEVELFSFVDEIPSELLTCIGLRGTEADRLLIVSSVSDYACASFCDWARIFLGHVNVGNVPCKKIVAGIIVGAAKLSASLSGYD